GAPAAGRSRRALALVIGIVAVHGDRSISRGAAQGGRAQSMTPRFRSAARTLVRRARSARRGRNGGQTTASAGGLRRRTCASGNGRATTVATAATTVRALARATNSATNTISRGAA